MQRFYGRDVLYTEKAEAWAPKGQKDPSSLSQDGNDPNRSEMYRHKAHSGRKQLPSPLGDEM